MIKPENEAYTLKVLKEKKIVTIQQLSDLLECSRRTAQRRLKEWQTHNSYNKYGNVTFAGSLYIRSISPWHSKNDSL